MKGCCERDPECKSHTAQRYNGLQQEPETGQGTHVRKHKKKKFYRETDSLNAAKMVIGQRYRKFGSSAPGHTVLDHTTQSMDPIQNCSKSYDSKSVLVGFVPD